MEPEKCPKSAFLGHDKMNIFDASCLDADEIWNPMQQTVILFHRPC